MTVDEFAHFVAAQEPVYPDVVQELEHGRKTSHWMWFIFPQLLGLGHSNMSVRFGLRDLAQAARYAFHPLLGPRLYACPVCNTAYEGMAPTLFPCSEGGHAATMVLELVRKDTWTRDKPP